jgi:REP element-mobilizing transposase RayT
MSKLPHRTGPGRTYFVSSAAWERRELFRVPHTAELLVQRILACRDKGAYLLHEFVVMPNHFHLLITPDTNTSLEKAVQLIKGEFSHEFHKSRELEWKFGKLDFMIGRFETAKTIARKSGIFT